jgi:hypothetical protein
MTMILARPFRHRLWRVTNRQGSMTMSHCRAPTLLMASHAALVPTGAGRSRSCRRGRTRADLLPGHLPGAAVGDHDGDHPAGGERLQRLRAPPVLPARSQNATVQVTLLNFQSQFLTRYDLLFATILLVAIPPLIMFIFFNWKIVAGMAAGSVKG